MPVSLTSKPKRTVPGFSSINDTPHEYLAILGKLNGIAQQIGQYLPQAPGIAIQDHWYVVLYSADQLDAFPVGLLG